MPNTFAMLVLFSWPLVAVALFAKQPPARAVSLAVIVGYLLLPARGGIDLPMIPPIYKASIIGLTSMAVMVMTLNHERQTTGTTVRLPVTNNAQWLIVGLLVLTLVTPFVTVITNREPVVVGPRFIAGLRLYDAVSLMIDAGIGILPFIVGFRVLRTPAAQTELLRVLVLAGCAYALLVLYEVRMSPQLSRMFYGFFPHDWGQHIRGDGFRPVVFLQHGLWLGIFLSMTTLACCALWRQGIRERVMAAPWLAAVFWMAITLILSRNLGATALMILFAPLVLFMPARLLMLVAATAAGLVLVYPMLRGMGAVPIEAVHDLAVSIDERRGASFAFRLRHEDMLLTHANDKPFAGWGTFGRNRIYDAETGEDLTVSDGLWVITISAFGWLGYLSQFGLLTLPLILLGIQRREAIAPVTAGLGAVMAVALIDLIPNATLTSVTWLLAGSLAGKAVADTAEEVKPETSKAHTAMPRRASLGANGPLSPVRAGAAPTAVAHQSYHHRRVPRH